MPTLKTTTTLLPAAMLLALAVPGAQAQQTQHDHEASPYADTQSSEIPSLTQAEIDGFRAGEGMGLARPAELNHFPGPKHVLELQGELSLSAEQAMSIAGIGEAMTERASAKGEQILMIARHMDEAFGSASITPETLTRMTAHLATLKGELQAIHLLAHLETSAALTPEQVALYDELRGHAVAG